MPTCEEVDAAGHTMTLYINGHLTATVYAHVRLRLQRDAIDLLGNALRNPVQSAPKPDDGDEPPLCATSVR